MNADVNRSAFDGRPAGTMHKVIPWAFQQQGLHRPKGARTTDEGKPDVDVFIDDGRNGHYTYQANFWSSRDIWNRLAADGLPTHQHPANGTTNYLYVRIKNRGLQTAKLVKVRAFHTTPSAGLVWKDDWNEMKPGPTVKTATIVRGGSEVIGPFEWVSPSNNDQSLLAIVSASGDHSNVDPVDEFPCGKAPTPGWMLVPFDNNMAQRNISRIPGGGGKVNLVTAFKQQVLRVKNPFNVRAHVDIETTLRRSCQAVDGT